MTDKKLISWLRLHGVMRRFEADHRRLLSVFPDPEELFAAGESPFEVRSCLTPLQRRAVFASDRREAEETLELVRRNNLVVLTPDSPLYPESLKDLKDFPLALFCRGQIECLSEKPRLAVVGSRDASEWALDMTRDFCENLARRGVLIISGGALGVDSAAHRGALDGGGRTVAVLGSGFGSRYLMSNEKLRVGVTESGALMTELFPFESPTKGTFPKRNRIIAALSNGVFVAEARYKSGSLVTARRARELRRPVFVHSSFENADNGAGELLRTGATGVAKAEDISAFFAKNGFETKSPREDDLLPEELLKDLDPDEKSVMELVIRKKEVYLEDMLALLPDMSPGVLTFVCARLTGRGLLVSEEGKYKAGRMLFAAAQ
ncbi:MAG: DNA-processing protein DprA [Clostridia bacterium]|nr:DNA-processing protein DprA [Clostridia bacterium]